MLPGEIPPHTARCLPVGNAVVFLQQQDLRQERGRKRGPPHVLAVHFREVIVRDEHGARPMEQAVKLFFFDERGGQSSYAEQVALEASSTVHDKPRDGDQNNGDLHRKYSKSVPQTVDFKRLFERLPRVPRSHGGRLARHDRIHVTGYHGTARKRQGLVSAGQGVLPPDYKDVREALCQLEECR